MAKWREDATPWKGTGATVGYEAQLWQMADAMLGNMEAAKYERRCGRGCAELSMAASRASP